MTTKTAAPTITTHCHRCGRVLSDPTSVAAGTKAAAATEPAERLAKATELVEDGGIVRVGHLYLAVSSDGTTRYEVAATGECTCTAAQYGRACYHGLAARLVAAVPVVEAAVVAPAPAKADPFAGIPASEADRVAELLAAA